MKEVIVHWRRFLMTTVLALAASVSWASPAYAASVRVTGLADCVGMLGYPSPDGEPATSVRITTSLESPPAVGVNGFHYYGVNMSNVPAGGVDATATISCRSGKVWTLPFRLTPTATSLDLTQPTPVDFTVHLKDPKTGAPVNAEPVHRSRPLSVEIFDGNNQQVATRTVTAQQFRPNGGIGTDQYNGTVYLGHISGVRYFKVRLDYTLKKQPDGFINVPGAPGPWHYSSNADLTVGDVNQDNRITSASSDGKDDYTLMMNCYSDLAPPRGPCNAQQKRAADITDDGKVNQFDYNLFLRIIGSR